MAEKTIIDRAGETIGVGIGMASDVADAIKSAVVTVKEVMTHAPAEKATKTTAKKAVAKKVAKKAPGKKVAEKAAARKTPAKKTPAKKSVKKPAKKRGRSQR